LKEKVCGKKEETGNFSSICLYKTNDTTIIYFEWNGFSTYNMIEYGKIKCPLPYLCGLIQDSISKV
jgi:hypothetical protein